MLNGHSLPWLISSYWICCMISCDTHRSFYCYGIETLTWYSGEISYRHGLILKSISHLVSISHSCFLAFMQSAYYVSCYWIWYMHSGDKYTSPQKCDSSYKPLVYHCLISRPSPLCPTGLLWEEFSIDNEELILCSIFILQLMIFRCQNKHV